MGIISTLILSILVTLLFPEDYENYIVGFFAIIHPFNP